MEGLLLGQSWDTMVQEDVDFADVSTCGAYCNDVLNSSDLIDGNLQPKAFFDHVLACFGPDRIMWGSDWPVLELAGDYAGWAACAQEMDLDLDASYRGRGLFFKPLARRRREFSCWAWLFGC